MLTKNESNVPIFRLLSKKCVALASRMAKISSLPMPKICSSSASSALFSSSRKKVCTMRSFISLAAFLVKVSAVISRASAPESKIAIKRTLSAKVLPLPALASRAKNGFIARLSLKFYSLRIRSSRPSPPRNLSACC